MASLNDCHFEWNLQPSHTSKDGESLLHQIGILLSDNPKVMTIPALLFEAFIYVSDYAHSRNNPTATAFKCLEHAKEKISKCQNEDGAIGYKIVYNSLLAKIYGEILMNESKAKAYKRSLMQLSNARTNVSDAFICSVRAFALSRLGPVKLDDCIEYFEKALEACPENTEWLFGLALVYGRKTKLVQGLLKRETERTQYERNLYEKILAIDSHHVHATLFLAELLFQEGKIPESRLKFEEVLKIAPDNMKVNTRAAKFFRKSEQWGKALALIEKAEQLKHTKPDSMLYHEKAMVYVDKYHAQDESLECRLPGETSPNSLLQMALSELDKAVGLSSCSVFFGLERARVLVKLEQYDDANNEYIRLLRVKNDKSWRLDVVRIFLEFGRFLVDTELQDIVSAMGYIRQGIEEAVCGCTSYCEHNSTKRFLDDIRKEIEDAILSYEEFYLGLLSTNTKDFNASNNLGWLKQILAGIEINFKDPTTAIEYYQRVYKETIVEHSSSMEIECLRESLKGLVECSVEDRQLDLAKQYRDELRLFDQELASTLEGDLVSRDGVTTSIEQDTGEELKSQTTSNYMHTSDNTALKFEDLTFGERLGAEGVLRVSFKSGKYKGFAEAAAKVIPGRGTSMLLVEEVSIMKALQHKNIVQFLDFVAGPPAKAPGTPDPYYIVMEKGKCSLDTYLDTHDKLERSLQNKWVQEASAAIGYLHEKYIVHRDIKPGNCIIFPEQVLKVSDFGISCEGNGTRHTSKQRGTEKYTAPEVDENRTYSEASDVWALGILFWHIYASRREYGTFPPDITDDFPKIIKNLLPLCWGAIARTRPTINEVIECVDVIYD